MRALFHLLLRIVFRFRAFNTDVLNTPGPVLLIPNHLSWIDWLFLAVLLDQDWKFVVSSTAAQASWLHRKIMLNDRTFPVDTASPYAVKRMAEYLQDGGRLVLFAEGRLSRTGSLMKIFDGTGFLLFKTHAKVITCYLRGAHRVPYSPHPGWRKLFTPVTAHFSTAFTPPLMENVSTGIARQQMTNWLRDQIIAQQFSVEMEFGPQDVLAAIVETAQQRPHHLVLEDVTYQELTYRRLLVGADVLGRQLEKAFTGSPTAATGGERVGVLLPNVNATPVVILALWSLGKVPSILNFSTGPATMLACTQLAGLKRIITSRAFLERAKLQVDLLLAAGVELIYLEDVRARITGSQKALSLVRIALHPRFAIRARPAPDAAAVVLFTSGSEGVPKGVELSHRNILANIRQMQAIEEAVGVLQIHHVRHFFCEIIAEIVCAQAFADQASDASCQFTV